MTQQPWFLKSTFGTISWNYIFHNKMASGGDSVHRVVFREKQIIENLF